MNISKNKFKVNILLILSVSAIALVIGLSIWQDAFLESGLLCLAIMAGLIALAIVLTRPVWFLYLLSFFIPFSQSVPLINIAGRNLHIGFDTVVIIIIMIGYIIRLLVKKIDIVVFDKALKWLLIWWFWNLCMLALTATQLSGVPRADAVIVFLRWSQYIPIFFIVLNMNVSSTQVKTVLWVCAICAVLITFVNIFEFFIIGVDYTKIRGTGLAVKSLFIEGAHTNYNISAAYLATVGLAITPFLLLTRNWRKLSGITIMLFLLIGIWMTSSRSGLFACIFGFLFLGMFYFRRALSYSMITLVPLGMAGLWFLRESSLVRNVFELRYIPQALPMLLGADLQSLGLPLSAGGGVQRLFLWGEAFRFFMQSPIWGHGFRATRWSMGPSAYFTADSYYLEMLADTGLVGLMFFFLFAGTLYMSAIRLHKLARENAFLRKFSIGYQAAFVGLMFVNLFGGMFMSQKIWGIFILLSALMCNQLHRLRKMQKGKTFTININRKDLK